MVDRPSIVFGRDDDPPFNGLQRLQEYYKTPTLAIFARNSKPQVETVKKEFWSVPKGQVQRLLGLQIVADNLKRNHIPIPLK